MKYKNHEVLHGWDMITDFMGYSEKALLKHGYPIKVNENKTVYANRQELIDYSRLLLVKKQARGGAEILRGWESICAAAGGMHQDTARRLMHKENFPVKFIGGKPMSTLKAIEEWVESKIAKTCQGKKEPSRHD
jgi:hypothetical protein